MIEIAPSQIYTIRDVAEYFKCSTRKVHRLIATGQLRGFKIGNQRRFKGEEILRFIEQQGPGDGEVPVIASAVQADRLYSLREVSGLLHIPTNDALALLRAGRLPGFRVGMEWRCWGRDLLKLLPAHEGDGDLEVDQALQPSLLQSAGDDGLAPAEPDPTMGTAA